MRVPQALELNALLNPHPTLSLAKGEAYKEAGGLLSLRLRTRHICHAFYPYETVSDLAAQSVQELRDRWLDLELGPCSFELVRHDGGWHDPEMNWLAVLCAGLAYWILGFIWYSLLFGGIWGAEQQRHRRETSGPAKREFAGMLLASFVANLVASAAIAYLLRRTGTIDMEHALKLGAGLAAGFSITTLTVVHVWEGKSTKVWIIDASYHLIGCMIAAAILVSWRYY